MSEDAARNRERQAALYGEPLGVLLGRIGERLGLTQARLAGLLGLSAPMVSQLMTGQRIKIGNPMAVQRLQALAGLSAEVAAGRVALADVESHLAAIPTRAGTVVTGTASVPTSAPTVRAVQGLLRAVASADDLLGAADTLSATHPEIAEFLRVYGAGRTADAVAHFDAHAHLL